MSMYTQLLGAALEKIASSTEESTTGEALVELLRCRNRLDAGMAREGPHWATDAIADELAYDIALIELARGFGVECDVSDFDNPRKGRAGLERDLGSRGIRLGVPDEETQPC